MQTVTRSAKAIYKTVVLFFLLIASLTTTAQQFSKAETAKQLIQSKTADLRLAVEDMANMKVSSETYSKQSGVSNVYFQQMINGIPVYNAILNVHVTRNNQLLTYGNRFFKSDEATRSARANPLISAEQALIAAMSALSIAPAGQVQLKMQGSAPVYLTVFDKGKLALEDIKVQLVYQPMEGNAEKNIKGKTVKEKSSEQSQGLRLAWQVEIYPADAKNYWSARIDAATGELLDKNNYVVTCDFGKPGDASCSHALNEPHQDSFASSFSFLNFKTAGNPVGSNDYRVYPQPVESPIHTSPLPPADGRTLVSNPANLTASPFGWHDTNGAAGAEFTTTQGNNAHAYTDVDANNIPDVGSSPDGGVNLVFDFPLDLTQVPSTYRPAAVTNLFYWNNYIHDFAYLYGFDEASGNFQVNNYGNGGVGNDYVQAEAQDGSGTNNANFSTPPDGSRPRMQMFIGTNPTPDIDGDFDNGVIAHEYAHGISNRLTGGPATTSCLSNQEQMGEGWSDFYGYMTTMKPTDVGTTARGIGNYLFGQPANGPGIRPFPYSTNMVTNPATYNTIKTVSVPHGVGFVWASMLWDLNWKLIDVYGYTAGFNKTMQLVNDGMKLQPCSPGFVDGRNAILAADQALYAGANQCLIWEVFARRGLGFSASQGSSGSRLDGVEAFDINPACLTTPFIVSAGSAITAETCSPPNSAIDPNETVTVDLTLSNSSPINSANLVATLQATGGVTSPSGPQNYGVVAIGAPVTRSFSFTAGNLACGQQLTATLQLQDGATNLGTVTYTFTIGADVITISENFDGVTAPALPAGWVATNVTGAAPLWVTSSAGVPSPVAISAPNSIFIDDPAVVTDKQIVTPTFTPGATDKLSFANNFSLESTFDGGVLEISINGGAFTDIITAGGSFVTGGYTGTISASFGSPIAGRQAWTGTSPGGFITTTVNLPAAAAGMPCQLKFRMGSDNSVTGVGWRVDNLTISTRVCCTNNCTPPVITAPTVTQPTCATQTGTIVVNATGGGTLEYSVDNGSTYQASATFSGLVPGNYNIKARLQASPLCEAAYANNPVVIIAATGCCVPPDITAPTVTQPTCLVPTGTIVVNATGNSPLEYSVDNGATWQPSATFSGLAPGSYNIKVRIQTNPTCESAYASNPVVINPAPPAPVATLSAVPAVVCNGGATKIYLNVSGGTGPFTVTIQTSQGQSTTRTMNNGDFVDLAPISTGILNVFISSGTDANGCSLDVTNSNVIVTGIANPTAVATPSSQTTCSGSPFTTIVLSGTGTVYDWTRDNTATVTGIAASGSGNISGSLTNTTATPVTVTFTITPSYTNGNVTCEGTPITATVTVNPASYFACPGNMIETITSLNIPCFKAVNTPNPAFCGTLTKLTWKLTGATVLSSPTSGINYLGLRNMNVGTTTVTYTATFAGAIVRTCSFTVLVIETVPPNIYCPLDKTVTTDVGKCYRTGPISLGTPVVNDNCGIASVTNNAPAVYLKGENLVTWTVTDKSGNTRTCVQKVTVIDAERPTITCPASLIVNADPGPGCGIAQLSLPLPVFNDNCGVVTLTWTMVGVTYGSSGNTGINYVPTMNYLVGISTITYTAIDEAGNSRTCTFRVTVKDVTAPVLVCPPAEIFCKVANNTYSIPTLVQSDNCVIVSTTFKITGATSRTGSGTNASGRFNLGVSTILWTVKDSHGNISTCTTVITVVATSNPVCAPPPFAEKGANPKFTETVVPGLSITAWPNPTVNYFNLRVTSQAKENVVIRMFDMAGKLVQVKRGAAGDTYILGEGVVSGMYFIEVSQGDKTARAKVVKQ